MEQRFRTVDGGWLWYEIKGVVYDRADDGSVSVVEGTYHSVDNLKQSEAALERNNRALRLLVAAYDASSKTQSGKEALDALVVHVSKITDCPLAWIGEAFDNDKKIIQVISSAGPASEFSRNAEFRWDDSEFGSGPSGMCIKTGKPSFVGDVLDNKNVDAWRDALNRFGIRSGVSVPIVTKDNRKYVLHIAGASPQQFSEEDLSTYETLAKVLELILDSADIRQRFSEGEIARQKIAERLQKAGMGAIMALSTVIEKRDPYTAGHQLRVAELSVAIGQELGLPAEQIEGLRIGASIHDIGKIGVPTEILSKPGRLDDAEIALIRRHAQIGYEIVSKIDFGWPIGTIVHQHHERCDGSGYPQGLTTDEIALEARVVAVADVIESMATDRPYRAKIPWQLVINEISDGRGSKYCPSVVDAALSVLERDAHALGYNL